MATETAARIFFLHLPVNLIILCQN